MLVKIQFATHAYEKFSLLRLLFWFLDFRIIDKGLWAYIRKVTGVQRVEINISLIYRVLLVFLPGHKMGN